MREEINADTIGGVIDSLDRMADCLSAREGFEHGPWMAYIEQDISLKIAPTQRPCALEDLEALSGALQRIGNTSQRVIVFRQKDGALYVEILKDFPVGEGPLELDQKWGSFLTSTIIRTDGKGTYIDD